MIRLYSDYVRDILESMAEIESFISGMDFGSFSKDRKTINAVVRSLEVIGEASKKIPESVKSRYPALPWKHMAAMRDKLIHEYFGIDESIVWTVASEELPPLKKHLKLIMQDIKE